MNIISNMKGVFDLQIRELEKIKNKLDFRVEEAVNMILQTSGKVVVTGVGKSGLIGKKIAATLASTGTISIFIHSTEGLHGDLGMINKGDIVLGVSNSGNTEELLAIIPTIKRLGCKIIAITGNKHSRLANESDIVLDIGVDQESCPMNLAPTSSTTATLVLGDAIASCLMKLKKFTPEDYAVYHPGGILGKRLLLRVKDIMQNLDKIAICSANTRISQVVLEMTKKNLGIACVIDDNSLQGIVTEGDLRRALIEKDNFFNLEAKDIMTKNFKSIEPDKLAMEALELMEKFEKQISVLPVLNDKNNLLGVLRLHDLFILK